MDVIKNKKYTSKIIDMYLLQVFKRQKFTNISVITGQCHSPISLG